MALHELDPGALPKVHLPVPLPLFPSRCDFFGQIALFFFVNHIFWTVTVVEFTYYYVTRYVKDY